MKKLLILFLCTSSFTANAQDYFITFIGAGASSTLYSVIVENLTSGKSLVISGSDILHLTSITTGVNSIKNDPFSKIKIYPNPMTDYSTIRFYPPVNGDAVIYVIDITGKTVAQIQSYLENSLQEFRLSGIKDGFYLINVTGYNYHISGKLLSNGNSSGAISIEKVNSVIQTAYEKELKKVARGSQATVDMEYATGDLLKFTGISGQYSTVKTDIPVSDKTIIFNFFACSDRDENNYSVVEIGDQVWMAENLKTSKYSDGTGIPIGIDYPGWYAITNDGFCWNGFDETRKNLGGFYNWYAVDVASNGNKNVCPTGWHVPTYVDWMTMENYLIANGFNYDGTTSENKIAKSLAGTSGWYNPFEKGVPGNNDYPSYRNKTGFSAIPTGVGPIGNYHGKGGYWWSATGFDSQSALYTEIYCEDTRLATEFYTTKNSGLTVRCLKGDVKLLPVLTTTAISGIKSDEAVSGGTITSDGNTTITARGVCWSTSSNPTVANNKTINGIGTGEFTSSIYGLMPETTYYVRAYATNSAGTNYGNELTLKTYTGELIDIEGNVYKTITIGTQVWMAENLRTTKYSDNTPIPLVTDNTAWSVLLTPGYCWYNNDATTYKATYGALYNWYAMDFANNGNKNVCPTGWHVPSYEEWLALENYLIANGYNFDGSTSGNKIAKSLAATTNWNLTLQVGAPGNTDYPTYRNKTNFTAMQTGTRTLSGDFITGGYGSWWSSTVVDAQFAWFVQIWWDNIILYIDHVKTKNFGYSVRCLQGELELLPVRTKAISKLTQTSVVTGGNIINDGITIISARGVCWSKSSNPTVVNNKTIDGTGPGEFTSSITGLEAGTTYYVRAYSTSNLGTIYGNELIFNTYTGSVTDIEGNVYNTVKIGTQVWMAENLKTVKYNDGVAIPLVTDDVAWETISSPGYCWYNNDVTAYKATYGALYNWYTVDIASNGNRNVCPTGWHVPTDAESTTLTTYLGGEIVAGTKLKETGTVHWSSPNSGTNESGFTALPGGWRYSNGNFDNIRIYSFWWNSSEFNAIYAWSRNIYYSNSYMRRNSTFDKHFGFSVRCLRDN